MRFSLTHTKIKLYCTKYNTVNTDMVYSWINCYNNQNTSHRNIGKGYNRENNEPKFPAVIAKRKQRNSDVRENKVFH